MKTAKRILSIILCLSMVIGYFTFGISAEEGETAVKVTDINDLAVGDRVIIAKADGMYVMSTTQNSNNRMAVATTPNSDGSITVAATHEVFTLEVGESEGTWAFKTASGYIYAASTSSNHLKTKTSLDANGSFSITIASTGVATIKRASNATRGWMRFNPNNGSPIFSCYTSGQQDISIYKIVVEEDPDAPKHEHEVVYEKTETQHTNTCTNSDGNCGGYTGSTEFHDTKGEDGTCSVCGYAVDAEVLAHAIVDAAYELTAGASLPGTVELTGVISAVDEAYNPDYSNITVTIKVAGKEDKPIMCYRMKGTDAETIRVGDTITVSGTIKNYNGTIEFDAACQLLAVTPHDHVYGEDWTLSEDGKTHYHLCTICQYREDADHVDEDGDELCDGCGESLACSHDYGYIQTDAKHQYWCSLCEKIFDDAKFHDMNGENGTCSVCGYAVVPEVLMGAIIDEAYELEVGATMEGTYELTGVISTIDAAWSSSYKNITVTIKVSGSEDQPIKCYRLKSDGVTDPSVLAVGDTITVSGELTNYNGTIEFAQDCQLLAVTQHVHVYEGNWGFNAETLEHYPTCSVCGIAGENCEGVPEWSYTEAGHDLFCETCDKTFVTGEHDSYTDVVTPPTCTEQGYTTHTCRCGYSYVDSYVEETGHANGDADHICDICGETLSTCDDCWVADRVIPATFESNAIQVYVCAICGAEKEEEIPNTKLVAVAVIGEQKFESLAEAVAAAEDGDVIELQMSVAGSGIVIDKSITINLNGYTYTVGDPTVGSAGTKTLGFQILKNNEVSIVNGTIKAGTDACKMLIQNYADLLLFGVTLDGTDSANMLYVLSNNCGYTSIEQSAIIAPEGAVAFDVYDYTAGGYTLPKVTVVMSDVEGIVEVDENVTLHIQGGDFTKATFDVASAESIDIYQGTFASAVPEEWCADGVIPTVDAEGNFTVKNGAYVARNVTTGVGYETLAEAIAEANENDTIKLLSSVSGSGIVINKSVTIDFGGFTYTFVAPAVGSTGTESNGFQILVGNTVTLKNGGLNVAEEAADQFYMLIQNYANLTITDMDLDGTNLDKWALTDGDSYVVSNNCGTVNINGETNITANDDGDLAFAFDVCKYGSYAAPTVNVNTTGTIQGKIEVSTEINTNLNISGGTFTQAIEEDWCAEGYVPVNGGVAEGTKVTWFNEDGTVIYSKYVLKGETAEYTGETPTKAEDETYTYTFDKWIAVEGGFQATFTAEEKKFELFGANVTLGNNLDMKFAFAIDKVSDWTGHYVKIVKENADGTTREQTYYYDEGQWQKDGNYYVVVFTGIAAKEMSDELTVTIYNAAGEAVSEPWVDSMRAYAMRQLNSDKNAENALLKTAIVDMLNYGAAAQKYFDYDEGNLANALLTDAQKEYATESTELTLNGYAKPQEYYYGSNLTLKSNIVFQIGFTGLTDDMTVEVAYTNHTGKVVNKSYLASELPKNGGVQVVKLEELVVSDARQVITITVKDASGTEVFTMQESIEEYMARRDKTDIEESFMKFSDSAHAYLHRNDK